MARGCCPDSSMVEVAYEHLGGQLYQGNGAKLFDGDGINITHYDFGYFGLPEHYVEFSVQVKCWLWQLPMPSSPGYAGALAILKWNGSTFVNTGEQATRGTNIAWQKCSYLFEPGRYQIRYISTARQDIEWFFEYAESSASLICLHPRNFTSSTKDGWEASWMGGQDYPGAPAWQAFDGNEGTRALTNILPASLAIASPAGQLFTCSGMRRFLGAGGSQGVNDNVIFETYNNGEWVEMWHTAFQASNGGFAGTPYTVVWEPKVGSAFRVRFASVMGYGDTAELQFIGEPHSTLLCLVTDPSDGAIKSYKTGSWVTVKASGEPTHEEFATHGMTLNELNGADFSSYIQGEVTVYIQTAVNNTPAVTASGLPDPLLALPVGDISLADVECVNSANLTYTLGGSGNIRLIVSVDSGVTWKTWGGTSWVSINPTEADVVAGGMTPTTLASRVKADWTSLIGTSKIIRFGYYLGISALTDTASVDAIALNVDMLGTWVQQNSGFNAVWNNSGCTVTLTESGSYKLVYEFGSTGGGSGVTDHGELQGLTDDDHVQYLNMVRAVASFSQLGHTHADKQDKLSDNINAALTGASSPSGANPFATVAQVAGSGVTLIQKTFLDVTLGDDGVNPPSAGNPKTFIYPASIPSDFKMLPVSFLVFDVDTQNVVKAECNFNADDASDFSYSHGAVLFSSGVLRLKTQYVYTPTNLGVLGSGRRFSATVSLTETKKIIKIEVI